MTRVALALLIWIGFLGCTPEPELDFIDYQPKLVIDGSIEQGDFARVLLTQSMSYFDQLDSAKVRRLVVTTAKVTVSTEGMSEVLTLKRDERFFPPFVYTSTLLRGEVGKSYTLTVEWRGQTYSAVTSIPEVSRFDALWFETLPTSDSLGYVFGRFTDDGAKENYYRVFTRREGKDSRFIPIYLSAIGDQSFNGKSFTFSLLRGPDNFTNVVDDLYFKKGEVVFIKLATMDRAHFDFWRTLERELYVIGNPFASSGNQILSNIDNKKALGVWGGYGSVTYRFVVE